MEWSSQQNDALNQVAAWLKNKDQQVFRLFGYAGSGKTTLAKHFAEGVSGNVMFGAYTGKAAHVLHSKGCPNATTIHQMMYKSKDRSKSRILEIEADLARLLLLENPDRFQVKKIADYRGELERERKNAARPIFDLSQNSDIKDASLIVIDECSMVDGSMGQDLLSFGTPVLVLGDPAQLPPVGGAGFFTEGVKPDILLDQVHRQAQDSPILELATLVRNGKKLSLGEYGNCRIIDKSDMTKEDALEADQIIVGRNATRHAWNRRMRKLLGRTSMLPEPDDKVVCLRNDHDVGLLNGALWKVTDMGGSSEDKVAMTVQPDIDGSPIEVVAHAAHFLGEDVPWWERKDAQEFGYGYALTCHKSQGSQWDDVLLFDESFAFRQDRHRWLYTAITRAAERLTIVRD